MSGGGAVKLLERYLALRSARERKCLLILGVTGSEETCRFALGAARAAIGKHHGVYIGRRLGERWERNRFRGVYFRNALWEHGYAVDTVETAVDWPRVTSMMGDVEAAGRAAFGDEAIHAYAHLSHVYPEGSSVYSAFVFRIAPTYRENMARWSHFKAAVSEAIVANRGTISHQHGVGLDHKPYLSAEKGPLGIEGMRALFARYDPDGMMNPGKLC